jgi:hypothetical protein
MVSIQYSVKLVFYTFLMWCNLTVIKTLLYLGTCFLGSHTKLRFLNGYLLYRAKPAPWYRDFFSNDIMYSVAAKRVWNRARQFFFVLLFTIIDGIIFSDWRQKEDAQSFLSSFFVSIIESSFRLYFMLPQIINRSNFIFFFIVYNWKSNTFWIIILVSGKFNLKNNDTLDRYKFAIFLMHVLCWLSHIIFQSM